MGDQPLSLRERLEAKRRRRLTVPILVDNPEPLQEELLLVDQALAAAGANTAATDAERAELAERAADLRARVAECVVRVEFQALESADFEALVAAHTVPDPKDGAVVDSGALLPVLAAHCAVDNSLRDAEWWAELLEGDEWTSAEKSHLYYKLFNELNYSIPSALLGKG